MATYIPNATQTTEPVESRTVESAALEFRTLKASINGRIEDVQDNLDAEIVNRIAGDANLQTQNNSQDVRLQAIEAALLAIGQGGLPGTVYVQRLSGTGAQTAFTLNVSVPTSALIDIFINGVYQNKDTFTIVGDVLTFSEAPPAGTNNVEVVVSITIANVETDASLVGYYPAGTGAVTTNVQSKLREFVSVKDFGAIGDGVANDTAALQAAINTGKAVKLISGEKYKITSPLTGTYKIHLTSDAGAEIYQDGQNFRMLDVSGVLVKSTTLSAAKEIGTRHWVVADAAGITPGMLMEVVSSASWYYDPRPESTDARKSEMHRVRRVSGSTLETDAEANDGYPLLETVTVNFYTPVSVYLENIVFRARHELNKATRGIYIKYADKALLQNVSVFDTSLTGVAFDGCYDSHHYGGEISGVNGAGAAYGGKFVGSTLCSFENVKFSGNYAAVDISGDNVISLMCAVVDCPVTGGGLDNAGNLMGWGEYGALGAFQRGHGSHGPSDRCVFRNNRIEGVHVAMPLRGRNHVVEDNYFESRSRSGVIQLYFGYNCTIKNNIVDRAFFHEKDTTTYEGANVNSRLADSFIYVYATYVTDADGPLTVVGNKINVQNSVIDLRDTVASDFQLAYSDNSVLFRPASVSAPVSVVSAVNPAILGNRTYINASRFSAFSSSTPVTLLSSNITLRNGAEIHNYSFLASPTYTGGVGWTSPIVGDAMVTFSGRFASVAMSISGGTITAAAGDAFSVRFTLPYMDTQSGSAGHFVGVCNSTTSSGIVNFNTTSSDIQCTLLSQTTNSNVVRAQFTYRVGGV